MVVDTFSRVATTTFKSLQGHHDTATMQWTRCLSMHTSFLYAVGRDGPLSPSGAAALDDSKWMLSDCRLLSVSITNSKELIMNQGLFVMENLEILVFLRSNAW